MKKLISIIILTVFLVSCEYGSKYDLMLKRDWHNFTFLGCCGIIAAPHATTLHNPLYAVPTHFECIPTPTGEVCGYDCKIAAGRAKCANFPSQRCIIGSSGYIACGFDCKRSAFEARCGIRYGDTCAEDAVGHIKCGLNCRVVMGHIKCDPSPAFLEEFPQGNLHPGCPNCTN